MNLSEFLTQGGSHYKQLQVQYHRSHVLLLFSTNTFNFVFSADLGRQRSILTTPFLCGVSRAVFRSRRHRQKWPTAAFELQVMKKTGFKRAETKTWFNVVLILINIKPE